MTKTLKILACLLFSILLLVTGCKENSPATNDPSANPEATLPAIAAKETVKLALITTDAELELDFDYFNVWDGIVSFSETNMLNYGYYKPIEMTEEAITQQFEYAVEDGATVIMCMGEVFAPVIKNMQTKYPDTKFIIINASAESIGTLKENTHSIMFRQEEGGYLAGYGAVKDGFKKIGYMGDHPSEAFTTYAYGYIQGANDAAKELNTSVEITVGYISQYKSKDEALSAVDAWYKDGVEIVMVSADDSFVEGCAKTAVNNLGYLIGTNNDLSHLGANLDYNPFMTSSIKGLREAVDTTLDMLVSGEWDDSLGAKTAYFGLQNGNYIYMPEYEATWLFKDFTLADYNTLKTKIANGEIVIDGTKLPEINSELVTLNIKE